MDTKEQPTSSRDNLDYYNKVYLKQRHVISESTNGPGQYKPTV